MQKVLFAAKNIQQTSIFWPDEIKIMFVLPAFKLNERQWQRFMLVCSPASWKLEGKFWLELFRSGWKKIGKEFSYCRFKISVCAHMPMCVCFLLPLPQKLSFLIPTGTFLERFSVILPQRTKPTASLASRTCARLTLREKGSERRVLQNSLLKWKLLSVISAPAD